MKTKEELNELKEEVETVSRKLSELSEEELAQTLGGIAPGRDYWRGRKTAENGSKDAASDSADS